MEKGKSNQHWYPIKGTKKKALISTLVENLTIKLFSTLMMSLQL